MSLKNQYLNADLLNTIAAFVWGILILELEGNSEKRMGRNKCISHDLCVLSQTIECIGMLSKKECIETNELEHFGIRLPKTECSKEMGLFSYTSSQFQICGEF